MARSEELSQHFTLESAGRHLPMWTEWGVRDTGVLIHSLGCAYITKVGDSLGYMAAGELPAPRESQLTHVEEDVRSDSVWFERTTRKVVLIAEFERYAGQQKDLGPKAESLLMAHHRWGGENPVLLLAYWSEGLVNLPKHDHLREVIHHGFQAQGGVRVPGVPAAKVMFQHFMFRPEPDGLLRLTSIFPRGES